jgi:hypothetical protein
MEPSETVDATFDPTQEPIDLLPLRPWEVRKVRARRAAMLSEKPAARGEARAIVANVLEAHRAALEEYADTPWLARFRRSDRRLAAIRTYRNREVRGLRLLPQRDE